MKLKMKKVKKHFVVAISIISMSIMLGFSTSGSEKPDITKIWDQYQPSQTPVRGGEFKLASTQDVGLMNPQHWPVNDWLLMDMIFESIITTDDNGRYVSWITESYEFVNPTTVNMKIRKGVTLHDGTPFTAKNIVHSIGYIKDKKNGCWSKSYVAEIQHIDIIDEYTIRFNLKKPNAAFLMRLVYPPGFAMSIKALEEDVALREAGRIQLKIENAKKKLSKLEARAVKSATKGDNKAKKAAAKVKKQKKAFQKLQKKYTRLSEKTRGAKNADIYPVGTGPFMFEDRSIGNWTKLKRNPSWWFANVLGKPDVPYFDGYTFIIIPDASIQLANFRAGKIHRMLLSPAQFNSERRKSRNSMQIFEMDYPMTVFLSFNHAEGPCKDKLVRKAISHAIDRKAIIKGVMFDLATPAACIFPADSWGHNPDLKPVTYNPELSKKLLKEAGYAAGLKIKGHAGMTSGTLAAAVKHMLAKVGIDWTIDILDTAAAADRLRNREYDMSSTSWPSILDPDLPVSGMYHPTGAFNFGRSDNKAAISLIEMGVEENDYVKRQKLYWDLEKVLYDNYEDAWLWHTRLAFAFDKNVIGLDAKTNRRFSNLWIRSYFTTGLWFKNQ